MLVVDDVLATGGTVVAAAELVPRLGGDLVGVSLLSELDATSADGAARPRPASDRSPPLVTFDAS